MWQSVALVAFCCIFLQVCCSFCSREFGRAGRRGAVMAKSSRSETGLSRRSVLKAGAGAGAALGALVIGKPGPFIGNAEAATPTLRLLMWQPYAMKDVIAQFEADMKAKFAPTFFD